MRGIPITSDLRVLLEHGITLRIGSQRVLKSFLNHLGRQKLLVQCDCGSKPRAFCPSNWKAKRKVPVGCSVCFSPSIRAKNQRKHPTGKLTSRNIIPVQPVYDSSERVVIYSDWKQAKAALDANGSLLAPEA